MKHFELEIGDKTYKLQKFIYEDGNPGLCFKAPNHTIYITNNMEVKNREPEDVIVRDYGESSGIYNWLLQRNIIEKQKKTVTIGLNIARVCKLLV